MQNPIEHGTIKDFCRNRGHGFIKRDNISEPLFVHISDIEGEYVPLPGDEVSYRVCAIPPKCEKHQAIHVRLVNFSPETHQRWEARHGI